MCRGTFLIEHHFRPGQHLGHDVAIRPVHIATNGLDGGSLPCIYPVLEQRAQTVFAAVVLQADHLAANQVGEDSPEVLPLAALDFITPRWRGRRFGRVRSHASRNARSARRAVPQLTACRTAA